MELTSLRWSSLTALRSKYAVDVASVILDARTVLWVQSPHLVLSVFFLDENTKPNPGLMARHHVLTVSIVSLIVAVGCVIAAVVVVQKNDIDDKDKGDCTEPPDYYKKGNVGNDCHRWKYNACMRGTVQTKKNKTDEHECRLKKDISAAILIIIALVAAFVWIVLLVWGLSMKKAPSTAASGMQGEEAHAATTSVTTPMPAVDTDTLTPQSTLGM